MIEKRLAQWYAADAGVDLDIAKTDDVMGEMFPPAISCSPGASAQDAGRSWPWLNCLDAMALWRYHFIDAN